jgi:hypothetical protein
LIIEHDPFKGQRYEQGIQGKKVAVVGYSHWRDGEQPDQTDFSLLVMDNILKGVWSPQFFGSIRNYFGFSNQEKFWSSVLFFNYVPALIGTGDQRFCTATDDDANRANARFERILDEYKPDLTFVFTKKTQLGALNLGFKPLPKPFQNFVQTARTSHGHTSQIVRLRHPQGADGETLKQAISYVFANCNR